MMFPLHLMITGLAMGVSLTWAALRGVKALHMLQLDSYANDRFLRWVVARPSRRLFDLPSGVCHVGLIATAISLATTSLSPVILLAVWSIGGAIFIVVHGRRLPPPKKPLIYTARAIRILAVSLSVTLIIMAAGFWVALASLSADPLASMRYSSALAIFIASLMVIQMMPLTVVLANMLLSPLQRAINHTYLRRARHRLTEIRPVVIGITGSYGKTSTKYLLEGLLTNHHKVLKTPMSFNTLMGVCRVINEDLHAEHRFFIVEMGAYRRGDIRDLCDLVQPTIGILTAIGPQHLERFKTLDNVQATKYELIEALPASGVAIFNNDDTRCRGLADRTTRLKVLRYGLDTTGQSLDLWAEEITMRPSGLSFMLIDRHRQRVAVQTTLLGRHNVLNLLGASCAAMALGLSLHDIAQAMQAIAPVPHRLQLIHGDGGVTVIDDSYNSNPIGAMEALDVLSMFTAGQRILVTPGMVELGSLEHQLNEDLGAKAAKVCDHVVLVGTERTKPLLAGLQRKDFPDHRIRVVADLAAATEELRSIVKAGDTVLFENDLPDLYV